MTDIDYDALAMLYGCTHKFVYKDGNRFSHEYRYYGTEPGDARNFESVCNVMRERFVVERRLHTREIGVITPLE